MIWQKRIFPPPYTTLDKGHGRIEKRTIQTSTALNDYLEFPYVAQVIRVNRVFTDLKGENPKKETCFWITSSTADKETLLGLIRGHWSIENSLHWVRDVTFDEDRSQIRTGSGPRVFASLRNLAISLLRLNGFKNIAAGLRELGWNKEFAVALIGA